MGAFQDAIDSETKLIIAEIKEALRCLNCDASVIDHPTKPFPMAWCMFCGTEKDVS